MVVKNVLRTKFQRLLFVLIVFIILLMYGMYSLSGPGGLIAVLAVVIFFLVMYYIVGVAMNWVLKGDDE